jgi:hypothetical protein
VDLLVSYESKAHKHPNMKQVTAPTFTNISDELFWFPVDKMPPYNWFGGMVVSLHYLYQSIRICDQLMHEEVYLEYLVNKPDDYYDLTLISPHLVEDCVLAFAHKARKGGKPWGHLFSSIAVPWVSYAFGNPGLYTYR